MPPVRNRRRTLADNDVTIEDLRRRCEEKNLSTTGRKATLISRLQQHASENTNPGTSTRSTVEQNEPGLLNDAQLSQIQSIFSRSIEQAMSEIATNAARAALNAIQNSPHNVCRPPCHIIPQYHGRSNLIFGRRWTSSTIGSSS